MVEFNAANERVKRSYTRYLREAQGRSEKTIVHALYSIAAYERFTAFADFKTFNRDRAQAYKKDLLARGGKAAAEQSARATIHSTLMRLRLFFLWLALEPGYRKSVRASDAAFLNLTTRDAKVAATRFERPAPTVDQMRAAIFAMPHGTDVEKRDRALVALFLLTGIRVKAATTLKLKHVRSDGCGIDQDAREVETKGAKSFPSFYLPVGDDVKLIFTDYVKHLQSKLGFGRDDPLFPSTKQAPGTTDQFRVVGLKRSHWETPDPVRHVFQKAFRLADLPYFHPHSVRRTLVLLGQQLCTTPEAFKVWSQNLGHSEVLTTFTSYGSVSPARQAQIIASLAAGTGASEAEEWEKVGAMIEQLRLKATRATSEPAPSDQLHR